MSRLLSESNGLRRLSPGRVACFQAAYCFAAFCGAVLFAGAVQAAAPKSENILPDTTKGYVSIGDVDALRDAFNRSQWGLLVKDPVLQDFVKDFQRQLKEAWRPAVGGFGAVVG